MKSDEKVNKELRELNEKVDILEQILELKKRVRDLEAKINLFNTQSNITIWPTVWPTYPKYPASPWSEPWMTWGNGSVGTKVIGNTGFAS